jgi:hypothetical protein
MIKTPRLNAILPLKIMVGTDAQTHFATTLDISASGARVILPLALDPGCGMVLEYKKNRVRAVVVWSRPMRRGSRDHQIGMRLLDDGQRFWLVELAPKAHVLSSEGRGETLRSLRESRRDQA